MKVHSGFRRCGEEEEVQKGVKCKGSCGYPLVASACLTEQLGCQRVTPPKTVEMSYLAWYQREVILGFP